MTQGVSLSEALKEAFFVRSSSSHFENHFYIFYSKTSNTYKTGEKSRDFQNFKRLSLYDLIEHIETAYANQPLAFLKDEQADLPKLLNELGDRRIKSVYLLPVLGTIRKFLSRLANFFSNLFKCSFFYFSTSAERAKMLSEKVTADRSAAKKAAAGAAPLPPPVVAVTQAVPLPRAETVSSSPGPVPTLASSPEPAAPLAPVTAAVSAVADQILPAIEKVSHSPRNALNPPQITVLSSPQDRQVESHFAPDPAPPQPRFAIGFPPAPVSGADLEISRITQEITALERETKTDQQGKTVKEGLNSSASFVPNHSFPTESSLKTKFETLAIDHLENALDQIDKANEVEGYYKLNVLLMKIFDAVEERIAKLHKQVNESMNRQIEKSILLHTLRNIYRDSINPTDCDCVELLKAMGSDRDSTINNRPLDIFVKEALTLCWYMHLSSPPLTFTLCSYLLEQDVARIKSLALCCEGETLAKVTFVREPKKYVPARTSVASVPQLRVIVCETLSPLSSGEMTQAPPPPSSTAAEIAPVAQQPSSGINAKACAEVTALASATLTLATPPSAAVIVPFLPPSGATSLKSISEVEEVCCRLLAKMFGPRNNTKSDDSRAEKIAKNFETGGSLSLCDTFPPIDKIINLYAIVLMANIDTVVDQVVEKIKKQNSDTEKETRDSKIIKTYQKLHELLMKIYNSTQQYIDKLSIQVELYDKQSRVCSTTDTFTSILYDAMRSLYVINQDLKTDQENNTQPFPLVPGNPTYDNLLKDHWSKEEEAEFLPRDNENLQIFVSNAFKVCWCMILNTPKPLTFKLPKQLRIPAEKDGIQSPALFMEEHQVSPVVFYRL